MTRTTRRLIYLGAIVLVLAFAGTMFMRQVPESVSAPLFVLVVIIEVIVAPVPGGAIGYMGAARFGFWQAWPLLYIGNAIGTTVVFLLARRFGTPIFQESVSGRSRRRYDRLLQNNSALLWLVYSVPLIPVDILSILAGLSSISTRRFLTIALTGYIAYTGIVAALGAFAAELVGPTEAVSALGAILLLGIAVWLWKREPAGKDRPTVGSDGAQRS